VHIDDILPQDMRYGCRTCNWFLLQPGWFTGLLTYVYIHAVFTPKACWIPCMNTKRKLN